MYERTKVGKLVMSYFKMAGYENPKVSTNLWFTMYNPVIGMSPKFFMESKRGRETLLNKIISALEQPTFIRASDVGIVRLP